MAATSICQKFNLKLIALLCCCHHDCSCYTLFIAAGQHLQHIFQMPSSYFAHAGGIRIQVGRGGSSPNYSHALRWIKHIPSTRIFWIAVCKLILQQGRKLCLPRQTIPTDAVASAWEGAGKKGSAGRDGNTAHASVNSRCQCVKLQGVIEGKRSG